MANNQITPFQLTDQFTMDNFNQRINETNIALQKKADLGADGKVPSGQLPAMDYASSNHSQAASTITAGTFAGQVVANGSGQDYSTSLLRNSKLVSAETNPTVNGEICWTYE